MKYICLIVFIFINVSCNNDNKEINTYYCNVIDTIIFNYYNGHSNEYLTSRLDELVMASNIYNNAMPSLVGYVYENDSLFIRDMLNYKIAFGCDSNILIKTSLTPSNMEK